MKKNKNAITEKEFAEEIRALQGLKIEEPVNIPGLPEIRAVVQDVTEKKERMARRSFVLFACIAAALLIGLCISVLAFGTVFIIIQLCSLLPLPFVAILYGRQAIKNG
jgi:tetrahydromethanopterin S-methyltransferase subunit F